MNDNILAVFFKSRKDALRWGRARRRVRIWK